MNNTRGVQPDRIPVFSKKTHNLLIRISEDAQGMLTIWGWNKQLKEWEGFTLEELQADMQAHKVISVVV